MKNRIVSGLVIAALVVAGSVAAQDTTIQHRAQVVFGTATRADLPTSCAESFPARLAVQRRAQDEWIRSHPVDTLWVQAPTPEDLACADEDARYRIRLVVPDNSDPPIRALVGQQILCFGDFAPSCVRAQEGIARGREAIRSHIP